MIMKESEKKTEAQVFKNSYAEMAEQVLQLMEDFDGPEKVLKEVECQTDMKDFEEVGA